MKMRPFSVSKSSVGSSSLLGYTIIFICLLVHKLDSAHFSVIGPDHPITASVGDEVILACRLSPSMSAKNMEVRWYRAQFSSVVHLYREGKDQYTEQMSEYRGRTEFLKDGLADGRVALRVGNIRLSDSGLYKCFFQSEFSYQEAALELQVSVSGTNPLISIEGYQDGGIRMVCQSGGWYPEPQSLWKELQGQPLPSLPAKYFRDENGLFQTESVLIVRENSNRNLTCIIRNNILNQEEESSIYIADSFFPKISHVTVILLSLNLLVWGFFIPLPIYYLWKQYKEKDSLHSKLKVFEEKLRFQVEKEKEKYLSGFVLRKARRFAVNVTLDRETAHPELWVSEDLKSVKCADITEEQPEDLDIVDSYRCVLGYERFNSGRHYWEVELKNKTMWHLGVCADSENRERYKSIAPEGGYWAIRLWNGECKALSTPRTTITLEMKPTRVGIFLDYEAAELSFYNLSDDSHIYTFKYIFPGTLRPFFSPGVYGSKEAAPLTICPVIDWQ
ncbi:butyrophilin subfamily 1 member A1-like isoform X1 [Malaclemys terrapin pileata]|uniref:butyrophilin subfamily 1 member A1-like isoform X1 n=1 Tax=Malaclemys terrapin pileata TaxID=2991368 RepID=UPI0023A7BFC9|nr:butyrophilin subfamily 1 member A1-like isoform X1 [Malaclemys terrapin pileata]